MTVLKPMARAEGRRTGLPLTLWVRKLHLYAGVLFAPSILFFALTGALQVYNLHKPQPAIGYQPPALVLRLASLHKDQTLALPHKGEGRGGRKGERGDGPKVRDGAPADGGAATERRAPRPTPLAQQLLKAFAAAVAAGLVFTTLLGLYMAYRFGRSPWLVTGLLMAGVVIPAALAAAVPG